MRTPPRTLLAHGQGSAGRRPCCIRLKVAEEPTPAEPERIAEAPANGTVINKAAPIEPFAVPAENSEPALWTSALPAPPLVIEIPASDLKQGKNSIAVLVNSTTKGAATTFDMIGEVR